MNYQYLHRITITVYTSGVDQLNTNNQLQLVRIILDYLFYANSKKNHYKYLSLRNIATVFVFHRGTHVRQKSICFHSKMIALILNKKLKNILMIWNISRKCF